MLIDLNLVATNHQKKSYDVCIVGAGPAGITVARILASKGKRVALFEGGDLVYSEDSQSLYQGKSIGLNDWDAVKNCRLRYFGGTSNHWAGLCSYFDEVDFTKRPNQMSGWPISRSEVFTYFDEAKKILDLPSDSFQHDIGWKGLGFRQFIHAYSPPTRFNQKYLNELKQSKNIDLYINANLTNILLEDGLQDVKSIQLTNYKNTSIRFTAKSYVLAMGSIENARMLLANNQQVKVGLGNHSDYVGRCYMEHFNVEFGRFVIDNADYWKNGKIMLSLSADLIKKHDIGSAVVVMEPNAKTKSYGRTALLKQQLRNLVCQSTTATDYSRKLVDFDCDGDGTISSMIEQSPNRDSRVTLDKVKDRFGIPRVVHNWQYNQYDTHTIRTLGIQMAKEMAKLGAARVQLKDFILDNSLEVKTSHHCHQMGTTRMSGLASDGVVDKNLKVHHLNNLYVAGSSVFPTGGGCNPTLTLTMLALRLANHLSVI
jgi:choline dehydrogenase-like flavoprotein